MYNCSKIILLCALFLNIRQSSAIVDVSVDFERIRGTVPPTMYSLNIWYGIDPKVKNNTTYQDYLNVLNLPFVRIHGWEMISETHQRSWVDFDNNRWNVTAIDNSLSGILPNVGGGQNVMINIPGDVSFITSDDHYADWCAELVDIVNNELGYNVLYWEPQNERQDAWGVTKMGTRYNKCAVAMKEKDASIKIGGPGVNLPWWSGMSSFLSTCKAHLDFVTYHHYGGGDGTIDNQKIYDNAKSVGQAGSAVRNAMSSAGFPASVPLYHGETNIVWSWDKDPQGKMRNNVGAVFDAILFKYAVEQKAVQSVQLWNDRDGAYGKMGNSNERRPGYYNLKVASDNLYGDRVHSRSNDSKLMVMATMHDTKKTVLLINRSTVDKTVKFTFSGFTPSGSYTLHSIKKQYTETEQAWQDSITIASESVAYLVFEDVAGAVEPPVFQPSEFILQQNYPNPFNPETTIQYDIPRASFVTLQICDIRGRLLDTLVEQVQPSGHHVVKFMNQGLPSGTYFCKLMVGNFSQVRKMLLVQ